MYSIGGSNFIDTYGGPFILADKEDAVFWTGIDGEYPNEYDRMCELLDELRPVSYNFLEKA